MAAPALKPGESTTLTIPLKKPTLVPGAEYTLTVSFLLKEATAWAEAGYEVAFEQFVLPWKAAAQAAAETAPVTMKEDSDDVTVSGEGFTATFSRGQGTLTSFVSGGHELIRKGPAFSVWRAPTDNDGMVLPTDTHKLETKWKEFGLHDIAESVQSFSCEQVNASTARVVVKTRAAAPGAKLGFDCAYAYTVTGSGEVVLTTGITPDEGLPELPRLGVTMDVPAGYETFTWYGRGPHESYVDRHESARIGRWSGTVDEQFYPYIMPQETGNKTEVRWAALTDDSGVGLLAVGVPGDAKPCMNTSVFHYDLANLCAAKHTPDLKRRDHVTFNLDAAQSGPRQRQLRTRQAPAVQPDAQARLLHGEALRHHRRGRRGDRGGSTGARRLTAHSRTERGTAREGRSPFRTEVTL